MHRHRNPGPYFRGPRRAHFPILRLINNFIFCKGANRLYSSRAADASWRSKLKFGYQQPSHTFENVAIFERLKQIALDCEEQGYDSFWIMDHLLQIELVGRADEPIMEAYTTLAALAAITGKIKLGVLATCNFFRSPSLLAKMGATIDQISNGRFWLGIGAGWFKEEATRYGFEFRSDGERLRMLEESLQIILKAWTEESPSFHGRYYSIENFTLSPGPVQKPRPPILVGGGGEKVTLRLVAKYADACNLFPKGEELRKKLDALKEHCKKENRDYSSILKTKLASVMFGRDRENAMQKIDRYRPSWLDLEKYSSSFLLGSPSEIVGQVEELAEIGIDYLIVNFRGKYDPNDKKIFSRDVMSRF
ncbi:MAG: TIGR03560 family F420-dependent LLM class oxidoreductase [Nitrososphaerales archaeon]